MWNILPQHRRLTSVWGCVSSDFKDAIQPQPCKEYLSLCDTCCLEFEPVFLLGELLIGSRRYLFGSSTLCEQPIKTWRQTTVPSGIRIQMQQVKTDPDLCFHNHFVFTYVLAVYNLDLKMTTIMTPMILFLLFLSLTAIPPVSLTSSCCCFFTVNCLIFQPTLKIRK